MQLLLTEIIHLEPFTILKLNVFEVYVLNFKLLKILFFPIANNFQLLCWIWIEYFASKWRQDVQSHTKNPVIFFEMEAAVWA